MSDEGGQVMAWLRLDDHFDEDPKLVRVGPLGLVLWLSGLAYCTRNRTGGFIPWAVAETLVSWTFLGMVDPEGEELDPPILHVSASANRLAEPIDAGWVAALLVDTDLWSEVEDGYHVEYWGSETGRRGSEPRLAGLPSASSIELSPRHLTVFDHPHNGGA